MSSKAIKTNSYSGLLWPIKIGLFAALFMPLIVNGRFIFPYIFPKQAFFQVVVEIVFALYIFLALKEAQYRPRSSWLFKALVGYFALMVLSSVFGVNAYHSFWSNYERMAGVVALFHYLGFLFVAANVFKTQKDWHLFFDMAIFAGVVEAFYGLGQLAGIFSSSGGARIDGTIGNASFLAGYMLLNAFFALWLWLEKKEPGWRIFYGCAIFLNLLIMYQTETRGAVLGLIFGLLALTLFIIFARQKYLAQLPFPRPERFRKYVAGLLVFGAMAGAAIWLARDTNFVKSSPTLNRVTHISASEVTARTRLMAWEMTLRGLAERPIFGWGPENYYVVFNKYYNPNLYLMESWFDRAHNAYLDVLINTGIIGFAAYLSVAFLALWFLWQAWRKEKIKYHTAVIFTAILISYGIQNFFLFDTQVTLLMMYSILAFIVWLSFAGEPEKAAQSFTPNALLKSLVVFAAILLVYFVNIKPGLANMAGINALGSLQKGEVNQSLAQFKSAFELGTYGLPEAAMRVQDIVLSLSQNSAVSPEIKNSFTDLAIEGMNKALQLEPLNARFMMMLSNIYLISAASNNSYTTDLDLLIQKAVDLSPTRQDLYFHLGQLRMYQGRGGEALAAFKKAVDLNDSIPISHWNYGVIAIGTGQKELGADEIKKARQLGHPFKSADIRQIINAYARTNDFDGMIAVNEEWIELYPDDAAARASLAAIYAQSGDKQRAKEIALQAAAIDPSYKSQAEEFIKGLGI